jgi:hypothetical protein
LFTYFSSEGELSSRLKVLESVSFFLGGKKCPDS